ncbi:Alpha/Beta hydrolase protein [Cladochytrium replicatum]|nr:Alpha/Beta hydrolase protein [Cladochytrium replicatum]
MPTVTVGDGVRVKPFELWYDTRGSGPTKLIFIMGLNGTHKMWMNQLWWFGEKHGHEYTALTLDNRGVGNSGAPSGLYSTAEMAKDVLELLAHVGWSRVHVIGVSMGGMIAQELALQAPKGLVASLFLTSTHAGNLMNPIPSLHALGTIPRTFVVERTERPRLLLGLLFRPEILNGPVPSNEYNDVTMERLGQDSFQSYFEFLRIVMLSWLKDTPPQVPAAGLSQLWASLTHSISAERLRLLRDSAIPTVVVTGTWDKLVNPNHSKYLSKALNCKLVVYEGAGHAVPIECVMQYNALLKEHVDTAERSHSHL